MPPPACFLEEHGKGQGEMPPVNTEAGRFLLVFSVPPFDRPYQGIRGLDVKTPFSPVPE